MTRTLPMAVVVVLLHSPLLQSCTDGPTPTVPGAEPRGVLVTAAELRFGEVAFFKNHVALSAQAMRLPLSNSGERPVTIVSAAVEVGTATSASELCVGAECRGGPVTLRAGELSDLLVTLKPTGVGEKRFVLVLTTDEPSNNVHRVVVNASVVERGCDAELMPNEVTFARLTPMGAPGFPIQVKNRQATACLLTALTVDAPFTLAEQTLPMRLEPNATATLFVANRTMVPDSRSGVLRGSLVGSPDFTVALKNTIDLSCLTISPDAVEFGLEQLSCNEQRTVTLTNGCDEQVVVDGIRVVGDQFALVSQVQRLTIQPSSGATIDLRFTPTRLGPAYGAVVFHSIIAGVGLDDVVAMHAVGDDNPQRVDEFRQDVLPAADLVVVLDDSTSMASHAASVQQNLEGFFQSLSAACVDLRVGVVAGSSATGTLHVAPGMPPFAESFKNVDFVSQVMANATLSTSASDAQQALLDNALRALDPSANVGFRRAAASAQVVLVTDGDDASSVAVADFAQRFPARGTLTVVGAPEMARPACVVDQPMTSSTRLGSVLATMASSQRDDLCNEQWLPRYGAPTFCGFRSSFGLSAKPFGVPGVKVDGVAVPSVDAGGNTVWSYDAATNAVTFSAPHVPTGGQLIELSYETGCR